jgi:hypothetical protein
MGEIHEDAVKADFEALAKRPYSEVGLMARKISVNT